MHNDKENCINWCAVLCYVVLLNRTTFPVKYIENRYEFKIETLAWLSNVLSNVQSTKEQEKVKATTAALSKTLIEWWALWGVCVCVCLFLWMLSADLSANKNPSEFFLISIHLN